MTRARRSRRFQRRFEDRMEGSGDFNWYVNHITPPGSRLPHARQRHTCARCKQSHRDRGGLIVYACPYSLGFTIYYLSHRYQSKSGGSPAIDFRIGCALRAAEVSSKVISIALRVRSHTFGRIPTIIYSLATVLL